MPRISIKNQKKLLVKWVIALAAVLVVMVCVALLLRSAPPEPDSPTQSKTTYPTTSSDEFVYNDNGFLICTTRPSLPGIDVSHHQGVIDWEQVALAGVEFAMIRLAYRGYEDGALHEDEQAKRNLEQAKAAGLMIGGYVFSQAVSTEEAAEEAAFALEILADTRLDLPLVYDWEYVSDSARTAGVDSDTLMACVNTFRAAVEAADMEPMVYFNQDLAKTKLKLKELDCPFWLAKYADNLNDTYPVRCWQYTDKGQVPGIQGFVDIDLYFP